MNKSDTLTISDLERGNATDPIWALNGSASSKVRQNGDVHVGIPKANGSKVDGLHLPQTWLPCCLTDVIPRKQLLDASEFRNAVGSGLIILITEDYAKVLLETEGAEEEKDRLNEREQQIKDATAQTANHSEIVSVDELTDINNPNRVGPGPTAPDPNALSAQFTMFVNNLKDKTDIEALNLIRGRGQFKKNEIRHMLSELRGKDRVVAFLKPHAD